MQNLATVVSTFATVRPSGLAALNCVRLAVIALAVIPLAYPGRAGSANQPNILFIMSDDEKYPELRARLQEERG